MFALEVDGLYPDKLAFSSFSPRYRPLTLVYGKGTFSTRTFALHASFRSRGASLCLYPFRASSLAVSSVFRHHRTETHGDAHFRQCLDFQLHGCRRPPTPVCHWMRTSTLRFRICSPLLLKFGAQFDVWADNKGNLAKCDSPGLKTNKNTNCHRPIDTIVSIFDKACLRTTVRGYNV